METSNYKIIFVGITISEFRNNGNNPTLKKLEKWYDYLNLKYVSFSNLFIKPKVINKRLLQELKNYDKIVALGHLVSDTLNKLSIDHFRISHPSPLNVMLNDPDYEYSMLEGCRQYLYESNHKPTLQAS